MTNELKKGLLRCLDEMEKPPILTDFLREFSTSHHKMSEIPVRVATEYVRNLIMTGEIVKQADHTLITRRQLREDAFQIPLDQPVPPALPVQGSGDSCRSCGHNKMLRTGTCMTCMNCGTTTGCG